MCVYFSRRVFSASICHLCFFCLFIFLPSPLCRHPLQETLSPGASPLTEPTAAAPCSLGPGPLGASPDCCLPGTHTSCGPRLPAPSPLRALAGVTPAPMARFRAVPPLIFQDFAWAGGWRLQGALPRTQEPVLPVPACAFQRVSFCSALSAFAVSPWQLVVIG